MGCSDKIRQRCGVKTYAPCVDYEKEIPNWSNLSDETCVSVEDTIDDLYTNVGDIKEEIDLSGLGGQCLTYIADPKVKDILKKYEDEICLLKEQVLTLQTTAVCNIDVTQCGIDLSSLEDNCNNPITTLGQLLAYLVTNSITP